MLFSKKKKRMIDVRELQKRGVVRIPKQEITIPTNDDGFVEFGQTQKPTTASNSDFFGFMDNSASTTDHQISTIDSPGGYNKREVDSKITSLDNKIYKLEQRIELLERKLQVNQPTDVGAMGW